MLPDRPVRALLAVLVYLTAISLGSGLLVRDPTAPLAVVPVAAGIVLVGHAWRTAHLDELGYAIMWMWAAVLAISVGSGLLTELAPLRGDFVPLARLVGTLGLTAVLGTAYALLVRRTAAVETDPA